MNEAHSSETMIGRDAAAALMEPLTDLVIEAGAAILAPWGAAGIIVIGAAIAAVPSDAAG